MKKWYAEEYEFTIEVTGSCAATIPSGTAATGKRSGTNTPALMAARSIRTGRAFVPKP